MIIQTTKPVYAAQCNMCGAENQLEIDYNHASAELDTQVADNADNLGYSEVNIHIMSTRKLERGQLDILVCRDCLQKLVSVLRWEEFSRFMPEDIKSRIDRIKQLYAGMNGASRPPEVHKLCVAATAATITPKGTIGLPATTAAILQHVACDQGCYGPEEQAALKRLVSQEGTIEDIGLFRTVANLAKVNLPLEAQLRDIDSVHEELRRNA